MALTLSIFFKPLKQVEIEKLATFAEIDFVIAPRQNIEDIKSIGKKCAPLEEFVDAGSIYEASSLVEDLSRLALPDGSRLVKTVMYKGYEMWWIHYNKLYLFACLPYTQYKRLLEYAAQFDRVCLNAPLYPALFLKYFEAHNIQVVNKNAIQKRVNKIPFGILLQACLTLCFLPFAILKHAPILLFTSDLFDGERDYDFRMHFIYEELRTRRLSFIECVRSLEPWQVIIKHALQRKRPVFYSEVATFLGYFMSYVTGDVWRMQKQRALENLTHSIDPDVRFRYLLATLSLESISKDVWAVKIMGIILRLIRIKSVYATAATDRNFHTVIACKTLNIPIVGILHGVASRHYNVYDFLPAYDGEKRLSVDLYGVWSEWWREYYIEHSRAYAPEQLVVCGLMRPLERGVETRESQVGVKSRIKVLFVSEQLAVPEEVLPYLLALLERDDIEIFITFRPYRDGFEMWLKEHRHDVFEQVPDDHILRSGIASAVSLCDVVVGTHSTAVLEALFIPKPIIFFKTNKWGDYFELKDFIDDYDFYTETPELFIDVVRKSVQTPERILLALQKRFFGNPHQNGSKWVVDQLVRFAEVENNLDKI